MIPYWLSYRFLNKAGIATGSVWMFDQLFVPATRAADRVLFPLPAGKNLVCTAIKR